MCRDLRYNMLTGPIPDTWLVPGAMPMLQAMLLRWCADCVHVCMREPAGLRAEQQHACCRAGNMLTGTLSQAWALQHNLPNINILCGP